MGKYQTIKNRLKNKTSETKDINDKNSDTKEKKIKKSWYINHFNRKINNKDYKYDEEIYNKKKEYINEKDLLNKMISDYPNDIKCFKIFISHDGTKEDINKKETEIILEQLSNENPNENIIENQNYLTNKKTLEYLYKIWLIDENKSIISEYFENFFDIFKKEIKNDEFDELENSRLLCKMMYSILKYDNSYYKKLDNEKKNIIKNFIKNVHFYGVVPDDIKKYIIDNKEYPFNQEYSEILYDFYNYLKNVN
jgi:hypothetical protein